MYGRAKDAPVTLAAIREAVQHASRGLTGRDDSPVPPSGREAAHDAR